MTTSVVWDLLDALVSRFTGALTDVNVIDGDTVADDVANFLMVGWDDPDNERATSAEGKQEWAGLGAKARYEEGTVTCLALSWDGGNDFEAARAAVRATTDGVETNLRADPNLGGVVPGLMWVGYGTRNELRQWLSTEGAVALCMFDIAFKAKI